MTKRGRISAMTMCLFAAAPWATAEGPIRTSSRRVTGFSAQEKKQAIVSALRKYGWSIPLCLWKEPAHGRPYCVTVARLNSAYPLFINEISGAVFDAALTNASLIQPLILPEDVVAKLTGLGLAVGCVPSGPDKGVVVIGETAARPTISKAQLDGVCGTPTLPASGFAVTLGGLVANRPSTPSLSLAGNGQATYQHYLDECRAAQARPQGRVMQGTPASSPQTDEEKLAEAQKKADEEKKKAADAEAKKAAAQKALDDAKK